jgi:hypothetical protein
MKNFLVVLILFSIPKAYSSCQSIQFNGASKESCDGGFNNAEYERDILKMAATSTCEKVTSLSTNGKFHCLKESEIPENIDLRPASAKSFESVITEGIESTSQTGLQNDLNVYITDHAGVDTLMEDETPIGLINYVSTYGQDEDQKERINYHSIRDKIIASDPMPGSNLNFVLDHCFSGAGLDQIIKATPPYLESDINTKPSLPPDIQEKMHERNEADLSSGFGACGISATKKGQPSLSNRSLGDITERFKKQKGRAPSNYELYLSSTSDVCYHSTPQLTSNLFAKNIILQDERMSEIVGGELSGNYSNFNLANRTILNNSEIGFCFQDALEKNGVENILDGMKSSLENEIELANKEILLKRIKEQKQVLSTLKDQAYINHCGALNQKNLQCYIKTLKYRLDDSDKKVAALEKQNQKILAWKFGDLIKAMESKEKLKKFADGSFAQKEDEIRGRSLEYSKEFDLLKEKIIADADTSRKEELTFLFNGAKTCRDKETKRLEEAFKTCRESNERQWQEAGNCVENCAGDEDPGFCEHNCELGLRKLPQDFFEEKTFSEDIDERDYGVREYLSNKFPSSEGSGLKRFENERNFPPGCKDALYPMEISPDSCHEYDCDCFKSSISTELQEYAEREVEEIKTKFEKEKDEYTTLENSLMVKEEKLLSKRRHSRRFMDQIEVLGGLSNLLTKGTTQEIAKFANMARCEENGMPEESGPLTSMAPEKKESQCK